MENLHDYSSKNTLNINPEEWKDLPEEEKAIKIARSMELADRMNREMLKDNKLGLFLYKLNYAVMRTGQPIPRQVCELAGVDKQTLKKLTREGFLNEMRVRNTKTGAEMVAYTVAEGIAFMPEGEKFRAVEVIPAGDAFDVEE